MRRTPHGAAGFSLGYDVSTLLRGTGKDQIVGDVPGAIGYPVSADDTMHVEGSTPEELEQNLIELGEFSAAGAKEIARHATLPNDS
uniref:hypothetical protein n=1 Tax=Burkholderia arboris TaxID=488730 RepID=UPI003BEF0A9B